MASPRRNAQAMDHLSSKRKLLSRSNVDEIQRTRILSAMVDVASEVGYIDAAVAPVVARAGVSRRTFYELFESREACFLAAFDWSAAQAREVVVEAYSSQRSWREGVRHALAALLHFFDAEPKLARLLVVEALGGGKTVLARRATVLGELSAALAEGAPAPHRAVQAPLLTAEGVVGGAFSVIHGRLLDRPSPDRRPAGDGRIGTSTLIGLYGELMALIALPYLGARSARAELARAAPDPAFRNTGGIDDRGRLLERLDMRLTYRTVRCLMFIGEHPGASNREIVRGAEIPDEGQASKLLGRLEKLKLIANSRPAGPGLPNHWTLTAHGARVLSAVS